ncbi:hypothetical protein E4U41_006687 [Claviceps citrina]|nr:hypothetical protein E4U41_006687 [Claviceps citrina]
MKNLIQLAVAATLAVGATANSHQHLHRHAKKQAGPHADKRDPDAVVHYVAEAVEVVYQLDGQVLDSKQAVEGLKDGDYVVVGETKPVYNPPPPPPPPAPKPSTTATTATTPPAAQTAAAAPAKNFGAQFVEKPSKPDGQTTTTTPANLPPPPPPKVAPPKVSPPKVAPPKSGGPGSCDGPGIDAEFPSGQIKCSDFPCGYGAVSLDWLHFGGYSGLQRVPGFSRAALSISNIITGIKGDVCTPDTMCSYACPLGYQKTQWPTAQGSTKQSIGGLYCNKDGYLELTRPSEPTLCKRGAGGVYIKNDLDEVVSACRTDYPGSENMVIPAVAEAGAIIEVTNPVQNDYYIWDGKPTSAQYYINKKGLDASQACRWVCPNDPLGCGNWAPVVLGVGQSEDGTTFLSIFQNLPTSTAPLDFNVEITGDVNSKCAYKNGQWFGGANGCTTGMKKGGRATIRYF